MGGLGLQYFADLVQILPTIHPSVQNLRPFSDKLKMTIENSNVIFFTETQNEHGKFQRHFLHLNPKWPWKIPTSSSPLKPEFTVVFPLFDIPLKSLGQNYYFIFVIAKPKTNWILDIKAFYSP